MTFFYKRVFPVVWFGFLLLLIAFGLFSASTSFLIAALLMGVFGYWMMKKVMFNLAVVVLDAGDALVVRSGGQEALSAARASVQASSPRHGSSRR